MNKNMNVVNVEAICYQAAYTRSNICNALNHIFNLGLDKKYYLSKYLNSKYNITKTAVIDINLFMSFQIYNLIKFIFKSFLPYMGYNYYYLILEVKNNIINYLSIFRIK